MKYIIVMLIITIPALGHAAKHNPCAGLPGYFYTNPDSTIGGFVASTATVDPTTYIAFEASVCEMATVVEGARILDRAEISGSAVVRGKVEVTQNAKVSGDAYLINNYGSPMFIGYQARIYGRAFLNGSVVVTDSSEVFGHAKILDFAQVLGASRVCGSFVIKDNDIITDDQSGCSK